MFITANHSYTLWRRRRRRRSPVAACILILHLLLVPRSAGPPGRHSIKSNVPLDERIRPRRRSARSTAMPSTSPTKKERRGFPLDEVSENTWKNIFCTRFSIILTFIQFFVVLSPHFRFAFHVAVFIPLFCTSIDALVTAIILHKRTQ